MGIVPFTRHKSPLSGNGIIPFFPYMASPNSVCHSQIVQKKRHCGFPPPCISEQMPRRNLLFSNSFLPCPVLPQRLIPQLQPKEMDNEVSGQGYAANRIRNAIARFFLQTFDNK